MIHNNISKNFYFYTRIEIYHVSIFSSSDKT